MTLAETLVPKLPPLREDGDGTFRVGQTRITLDTVIGAYWDGMTAEEIVGAYDSLDLADVHAVLAYYLANRATVDQHLLHQGAMTDTVRRQIESKSSWQQLRARLLQRRQGPDSNP